MRVPSTSRQQNIPAFLAQEELTPSQLSLFQELMVHLPLQAHEITWIMVQQTLKVLEETLIFGMGQLKKKSFL